LRLVQIRLLLILSIITGAGRGLIAQQMPVEWRVTNYDESKGLSNRKITRLLEDHQGYLWIGTPDGLNRFDGYSFKSFRKIPGDSTSIGGNYISYLAEDKNHNIWIAFLTGGISCYETKTGVFKNYPPNNLKGALPAGEISTIYADRDNEIWVGVTQGGLYHLDQGAATFSQYSISKFEDSFYTPQLKKIYNSVYGIQEDETGLFWLATHDGLYNFNKKSKVFTALHMEPLKVGMLRNDLFNSIVPDSTGFWLGSWAGGISHFNRQSKSWKTFKYDTANSKKETANIVSDLTRNARGDLWVTSLDKGFGIFTVSINKFLFFGDHDSFHANIPSKQCYGVLEDKEKNIWISHIGGLTKIEQRKRLFPFRRLPVKHSDNGEYYEVRTVVHDRDSNTTYIGTANADGLYIVDAKKQDTTRVGFAVKKGEEQLLVVSDILQDRAGRVWVLTRDYFYQLNKEQKKLVPVSLAGQDNKERSDNFGRLMEDSRGRIWITSYVNGVFEFNPDSGKVNHFAHEPGNEKSVGSDVIRTVAEDVNGRIWVGGIRGCLSIFDTATRSFRNLLPVYGGHNLLASNRVWSLKGDRRGNMWVATDAGLYQFNCKPEIPAILKLYTAADGLQADLATALQLDQSENIWAITPVCLSMINPLDRTVISFNAQDGLIKEDIGIRLMQAPGKKMYMASVGGYYIFDPAISKLSGSQPDVHINSFKIFDKERNFLRELVNEKEIRLKSYENFFSFEFVAIDFNRPERQLYAYMLEGFDKDWIYSGTRRYASYTNLPGGQYKFMVRASIGAGKWGNITVIPMRINLAFYKTWWFIASITLLFVLGLSLFIRNRNKKIKEERSEVEIQTAINYFASSIYEQQTVDTILKDVAKNCISRLHFEDCVVYLLDEQQKMLVPKAVYGYNNPNRNILENALPIPLGKGIVGSVAQSGKAELIDDTSLDSRYIIGDRQHFSEITVPMISDGKVLGIIDCEHSVKQFFTEKHLSILTTIASLCANKIVRAKAQEEKEQTREMLLTTQQRMADAEMQALRAQMNPHFIFNCLNSINRYIVKSDQATASLYLTRFAKLIRLILDNSNSKNVILANELEALKLYIEMEALRFDKKFDYLINISPEVNADSIEVPPLIIQPYVENAIWHGLLHKDRAGRLSIEVSMSSENMLQCIIEDNGIGRAHARELKSKSATTRKSLGIKLTEDRISLVNRHMTMNASVNILDITLPDGQAAGTKVIIKIPVM
jgi:ligand-binding sensor domain-containing protein/putative methionine-R-sulfoxide reductase with GAF domain